MGKSGDGVRDLIAETRDVNRRDYFVYRWVGGVVTLRAGRADGRSRHAGIAVAATVAAELLRACDSLLLPVARAMCDRLAALDGLVPPAVVARSTPSSPNAYRAVVQQQQLEKTASVPDLQQNRRRRGGGDDDDNGDSDGDGDGRRAADPASACADSKSDGCLTEACSRRVPVTSLSGTFLTPPKTDSKSSDGQKHQLDKLNDMTMATDCTRDMHQDGLVLPRKPVNPCLTSTDHQNLHRELLFNQKIGKNVLGQKSELQKALEKHKRAQTQKEIEQQKNSSRTPFERMIEERAKKIETQMEKTDVNEKDDDKPEFLQVHAKLRAKMAKTD